MAMPFAREHLGSRTSGRGDYTAIVDGSGRFFFRFGGHIQLFRRFVTPLPRLFWSLADTAIFQHGGLRRRLKLFKRDKTFLRRQYPP
ncbi:hypothetical protein EOD08_33535, partial [Mesorhizobium sp. M6A.T.Ca.TU.002.02.2.1]